MTKDTASPARSRSARPASLVLEAGDAAPKRAGRLRLLETSARLFGELGFDAVSTKDLTRAAGVTIGALYHHFASKEAIYQAAVLHALEALPPAPLAQAMQVDPAEGVELLVAWFAQILLTEPLLRQELLAPHLDPQTCGHLAEQPVFLEGLNLFRTLMPKGAPDVDPELANGAIVALAFGMTSLKGINGVYTPPTDTHEMARIIVRMVLH